MQINYHVNCMFMFMNHDKFLQSTYFFIHTYFVLDTGSHLLKDKRNKHGGDLLINGEAPKHGQVFKNPYLAETFKVGHNHSSNIAFLL